jgi:hypothetical protein
MGELNALDANSQNQPMDLAIIDLGAAGDICISTDSLRGGIVDIAGGSVSLTNDGACFTITSGCPCNGDLSTDGINPGTNVQVDFGDFNYFLGQFGAAAGGGLDTCTPGTPFVICPIPANLLCADISTDGINPGQNGQIDFGDFNYFLGVFGTYAGNGFVGPCLP